MPDSNDIKAGGAFIEIGADLRPLNKALGVAQQKLKAFGENVTRWGKRFTAAGSVMLAGLTAVVKKFADIGDESAKMARRTGISVTTISELAHAASLAGGDITGLEKAVKKMQRTIVDANTGLKTYEDALNEIGLTSKGLIDLTPEEQFMKIGLAIGDVENATKKAAAAAEIFGRAGTTLIPLFDLGADGIQHYREEARRLGVSLSPEVAGKAERLTDMFWRQIQAFKGLAITIGSIVAPWFDKMIVRTTNLIVNFRTFLDQNPQLVEGFRKLALTLIAIGTALIMIGQSVKFASLLLSPGGILATGIVIILALSGALDGLKDKWDSFISTFEIGGKTIKQWLSSISLIWSATVPLWKTGLTLLVDSFKWFMAQLKFGFIRLSEEIAGLMSNMLIMMINSINEKLRSGGLGAFEKYLTEQLRGFATTLQAATSDLGSDLFFKGLDEIKGLKNLEDKMNSSWEKLKTDAKDAGTTIGVVFSDAMKDILGENTDLGPGMKFGDIFKGLDKDFKEFMKDIKDSGGAPGIAEMERGVVGTFSGVAAGAIGGGAASLVELRQSNVFLQDIVRNTAKPPIAILGK